MLLAPRPSSRALSVLGWRMEFLHKTVEHNTAGVLLPAAWSIVPTVEHLRARLSELLIQRQQAKPYPRIVRDGFLPKEVAGAMPAAVPHEPHSHTKVDFIEELSGIDSPFSDSRLVGGGIHQTHKDGRLSVFIDQSRRSCYQLFRRINPIF